MKEYDSVTGLGETWVICTNLTSPCLNPVRRPFFLGTCSIGIVPYYSRRYPKISSTSYVNVDVFKDQYEEKIQEIWQNWLKPYLFTSET
jgi:hypothetical protein